MTKIISIEPAIDPSNRPTFLLDWELTMKCNLDCSYCPVGVGHDNSTNHPPLKECLRTIDFMYEYADKYMKLKPKWQRMVVLNVYGGESIFHPEIEYILEQVRERHTKYDWPLTVTCTTNAVAGVNLWQRVSELIDEFTISFHSEALPKQHQQVRDNILYNKSIGRNQKVVFVMHNDPSKWQISQDTIEFCKQNNIKHIVKANDRPTPEWKYNNEQFMFFKKYYKSKTSTKSQHIIADVMNLVDSGTVGDVGRSCCGGRKLCGNQELANPVAFMPANDFSNWYCSVNWYFLFVRQLTGDVFLNKDCRMRIDGTVGPIGNIADYRSILETLQKDIDSNKMPVIQCAKERCICGYCAPKAEKLEDFENIMKKHVDSKIEFTYNNSLNDK
jgi:hypothetical protein